MLQGNPCWGEDMCRYRITTSEEFFQIVQRCWIAFSLVLQALMALIWHVSHPPTHLFKFPPLTHIQKRPQNKNREYTRLTRHTKTIQNPVLPYSAPPHGNDVQRVMAGAPSAQLAQQQEEQVALQAALVHLQP